MTKARRTRAETAQDDRNVVGGHDDLVVSFRIFSEECQGDNKFRGDLCHPPFAVRGSVAIQVELNRVDTPIGTRAIRRERPNND